MLPVFVINLDDSVERWESIRSQAEHLGISIIRSQAVAGSQLTDGDLRRSYDPLQNSLRYHRNLTKGEIGCYLSHRKVWQEVAAENIQCALVLEDDVILEQKLNQVLKIARRLDNWDIIKLSDNRNNIPAEVKELENNFKLVNYKKVPSCANGYFVSSPGAKKLLSRDKIFRPVDVDFQFHSELHLQVVGILPYIVSEQTTSSDIAVQNGGVHSLHSNFVRNIRYRYNLFMQRQKVSASLAKICLSNI